MKQFGWQVVACRVRGDRGVDGEALGLPRQLPRLLAFRHPRIRLCFPGSSPSANWFVHLCAFL